MKQPQSFVNSSMATEYNVQYTHCDLLYHTYLEYMDTLIFQHISPKLPMRQMFLLFRCFTSQSTILLVLSSGQEHNTVTESLTSNLSIPSLILYQLSHCIHNETNQQLDVLKR